MESAKETLRRSRRYRLYPTRKQRAALNSQLEFACELYNAALEQRQDAWRRRRRSLSYAVQCRDLTDVRAHGLGPESMNCHAMRDPLRRVDRAFNAFFRRLRAGQKPGYPRFRSRRRYDSLTWDSGWSLKNGKLALQGIGHLRVLWHRSLPGEAELRAVTVRRRAGTWHVSFSLIQPKPEPLPPAANSVGLDLGISTFAVLSTGERLPGPRAFRSCHRRLRVAQRRVSRRMPGSHRQKKARELVARVHLHIRDMRRDHAFKTATSLVRRFEVIYVENLNLMGLAKSRLAVDIYDQAWGAFLQILTDKAEEAGRAVVRVDARNSSQRCSACGELVPKLLSQRIHECLCGYRADRDVNAARNLLRLGESRQARTWPTGASVA